MFSVDLPISPGHQALKTDENSQLEVDLAVLLKNISNIRYGHGST